MAIILGVNYVIHQFLLIEGDTHGAQRVKKNPKVFTRIIVYVAAIYMTLPKFLYLP